MDWDLEILMAVRAVFAAATMCRAGAGSRISTARVRRDRRVGFRHPAKGRGTGVHEQKLGGCSMSEGKEVKVRVRTTQATYTGGLFIPTMRNRFSDVINEPDSIFLSLTEVQMEGKPNRIAHLSLNKYLIESIQSLDE